MSTLTDIAAARLADALRRHCPLAMIGPVALPPFADVADPRFALDIILPPDYALPDLRELALAVATPGIALLETGRWRPHSSVQPPGHYRLYGVACADDLALATWRQTLADKDGPSIAHRLDLLAAPRADAAPTSNGAVLLDLLATARCRAMSADGLAPILLALWHLGVPALSARLALPPRPTPADEAAGAKLAGDWARLAGAPPAPGGCADRPLLRLYGASPTSGRECHLADATADQRLCHLPLPDALLPLILDLTRGQLPDWLAPTQFLLVPIADRHLPRARDLLGRLAADGIRAGLALPGTTMQARLRQALRRRLPWVLILGDRELADGTLAVRHWQRGPIGPFPPANLPELLQKPPIRLENEAFFAFPATGASFNCDK